MAERVERVVTTPAASESAAGTAQREVTVRHVSSTTVVARIIWWVAGVLLVLLAFRFVLALLGANPNNSFANFIYTTSHPFVAPFFSLFNYRLQYGVSRFEIYTLIAMGVYAVIAAGLARLATLNQPEATRV